MNVCGIDFHTTAINDDAIALFSGEGQDYFYQLTCLHNKTDHCWEAFAFKEHQGGPCVGRSPEHALCRALSDADKRQMKDQFYVEIDKDGRALLHPGDATEMDCYLGGTSDGSNWFEFGFCSPYIPLFIDGMEFKYKSKSDMWENAYVPGISVSYSYEKDPDCCYKHKDQRYTVTDARSKSGEATVYENVRPENVTRVIDGLFDKVNNLPF